MRGKYSAWVTLTALLAITGIAQGQIPVGHEHALRKLDALKTVPVPPVPGLNQYINDRDSAIALGKALFWDMNVGSDGKQACATCHFNAGADSRVVNQVSPGLKRQPFEDTTFQLGGANAGPNYQLQIADFPIPKNINDVVSSAGVHGSLFTGITPGASADNFAGINPDPDGFNLPNTLGGTSITRKVEPRNTPSVINAVYNYRNFWDGRAQNECNFLNPFGLRDQDPTHHLYQFSTTFSGGLTVNSLTPVKPIIINSSLCSQALGPALSNFEMSAAGRTFWDLGHKMLSLQPLSQQQVDPRDSMLGSLSAAKLRGANGLATTYKNMIQHAFQPQWWNAAIDICVLPGSPPIEITINKKTQLSCPAGWTQYTQAEYNFSLFWGLSIQLYESTLRSDRSRLDKFLLMADKTVTTTNAAVGDGSTRVFNLTLPAPLLSSTIFITTSLVKDGKDDGQGNIVSDSNQVEGFIDYATGAVTLLFGTPPALGDPVNVTFETVPKNTILTPQELLGLQLFQGKGQCSSCHSGPEMTNASVATVNAEPLERMLFTEGGYVKVYDDGFYNTGVRDTQDDLGQGANDAFGNPLSMSALEQEFVCFNPGLQIMLPARTPENIPAAPLNCQDFINRNGAFKAPSVRGVELTAPYFHNGGQLTLLQVVDFYNRGGDFFFENILDLDPDIQPLGLTAPEEQALVAFMLTTTDDRVKFHGAPFDHPSLTVSYGSPGGSVVTDDGTGLSLDNFITIPAVGALGYHQPLCTFQENINGFRANGSGPCP